MPRPRAGVGDRPLDASPRTLPSRLGMSSINQVDAATPVLGSYTAAAVSVGTDRSVENGKRRDCQTLTRSGGETYGQQTAGSQMILFRYDYAGRRVAKEVNGGTSVTRYY